MGQNCQKKFKINLKLNIVGFIRSDNLTFVFLGQSADSATLTSTIKYVIFNFGVSRKQVTFLITA